MRVYDSRNYLTRVASGDAAGPIPALARIALTPAAWLYGGALALRRSLYRKGVLHSVRLDAPTISVGNLTAGGTGKTPMVEWVCLCLRNAGRKPAILSRGYGAQKAERNDEARMLDRRLSGVMHLSNPDRVAAGVKALADGADCLVLDDAFQHMRIRRDLDIVLIDALHPFGRGIIPSGIRREPKCTLADADAIIISRADLVDSGVLAELKDKLHRVAPKAVRACCVHAPVAVACVAQPPSVADVGCVCGPTASGHSTPVMPGEKAKATAASGSACATQSTATASGLSGKRVFLFCGIGNPSGFVRTVERLGAEIVALHILPDHAKYSPALLEQLCREAVESGADFALTTEKDEVKIAANWPGEIPLSVLRIEIEFIEGEAEILALLARALKR